MKTRTILSALIVLAVAASYLFFGTHIGRSQSAPSTSSNTRAGDGSDIASNITLGTDASAQLGAYLIGYNGMTLYTYAKDGVGTSTCYGTCATNWPPYTVPGGMRLNIKVGVDEGAAGTIVRSDGTTQVTYAGHPLYFFAKDTKSGDAAGQGVGGVWYVVRP